MIPMDVSALPALPWKNGGGSTRTIAVSPPDAGLDDFDWRISVAEVASSGDFSIFPGVDRTILLLDGPGMTLRFDDGRIVPLTAPFEPHAFRGDDAVHSQLLGSSRDFNVMTRRSHAHAGVQVWRSDFRITADAAVFFCSQGAYGIDDARLLSGWAIRVDRPTPEIHFAPQTPDAMMIAVLITNLEPS
jgi:uncharacterized protein